MQEQIYILTYSSAHYAGAPSHCLVMATDKDDATNKADGWMQEQEIEQNYDNMREDGISDDESAYVVDEVQLLAGSEYEEYEKDEGQRCYYPKVNF